jgi:hypothetical protein
LIKIEPTVKIEPANNHIILAPATFVTAEPTLKVKPEINLAVASTKKVEPIVKIEAAEIPVWEFRERKYRPVSKLQLMSSGCLMGLVMYTSTIDYLADYLSRENIF